MASFRVFLVGAQQALDVELSVRNLDELKRGLLHDRYLQGYLDQPDENGDCAAVLIPASRLQMVLAL